MSRLWILPAVGLIATLGFACSDSGDDKPQSISGAASAATAATDLTPTPSGTPTTTAPSLTSSGSPSSTVGADWVVYSDETAAFSAAMPKGLTLTERHILLSAKGNYPEVDQRTLSFVRADGNWVVGVSLIPNPADLSLKDWLLTFSGWTGYPTTLPVSGEEGLWFHVSQIGDASAVVYVSHAGSVFVLSGNVFGSVEDAIAPTLSEADFDQFIKRFQFTQ
jgi:hypothetical protein